VVAPTFSQSRDRWSRPRGPKKTYVCRPIATNGRGFVIATNGRGFVIATNGRGFVIATNGRGFVIERPPKP